MAPFTLKYRSGQEIKKGDRVRFHGNPAQIEFVACDPEASDSQISWHMKDSGGGVMILEPKFFGRAFIRAESLEECNDLEFVSRE
jgi:hypothetical protein